MVIGLKDSYDSPDVYPETEILGDSKSVLPGGCPGDLWALKMPEGQTRSLANANLWGLFAGFEDPPVRGEL